MVNLRIEEFSRRVVNEKIQFSLPAFLVSEPGSDLQLTATSLPALPLIRQQTLILAGNDDPIVPLANAHLMHQLLPNADLHVFDDGHLGLLTSATELAPLVSRFLRPEPGKSETTPDDPPARPRLRLCRPIGA